MKEDRLQKIQNEIYRCSNKIEKLVRKRSKAYEGKASEILAVPHEWLKDIFTDFAFFVYIGFFPISIVYGLTWLTAIGIENFTIHSCTRKIKKLEQKIQKLQKEQNEITKQNSQNLESNEVYVPDYKVQNKQPQKDVLPTTTIKDTTTLTLENVDDCNK